MRKRQTKITVENVYRKNSICYVNREKNSRLIWHEKGRRGRYHRKIPPICGRGGNFCYKFHERALRREKLSEKFVSAVEAQILFRHRRAMHSALCFRITSRWEQVRRRRQVVWEERRRGGGGCIRNDGIIKARNPGWWKCKFRFPRTFGIRLGSPGLGFRSRTRFIFHSVARSR